MERKDVVRSLIGGKEGYGVITCAEVPKITYSTLADNRILCRQNLCGNYNKSWTCPPNCGSEEYCIERIRAYKDADIVMRTFDKVDMNDGELMTRLTGEFSDMCRDIMIGCRKEGFDVMALADGPCRYCSECSISKGRNCPYPDMQIPSVSGYGIDMNGYLSKHGIEFTFDKDRVTFYGIILFK